MHEVLNAQDTVLCSYFVQRSGERGEGRSRGRVPIERWSCGGVGPARGLPGGGRRGWCEEWARRG